MHSFDRAVRTIVTGGRWAAACCVVAFALAITAGEAQATPNFPDAIKAHLALAAAPPCALCHVGTPGRNTVNTPFGVAMRKRGLVAYDEGSLGTALDALAAENTDSDGDGTSDIRELEDGTNPNVGAGGADEIVPAYGCSAARRRATALPEASFASLAALAFAAASRLARRARRRHRCLLARGREP